MRQTPSGKIAQLRLGVLLTVLALLATALVFLSIRRGQPPALAERLHGDSEEAVSALDDLQAATPAAQRLPLLIRLSHQESPGARYAAVDALEKQRGAPAVDAVEQAFTDWSAEVRLRAQDVLPEMDHDRGLRLLLRGIQDEDSWIREDAAEQLKFRGDRRAVPRLIAALDDPDTQVDSLAMGALRRLTGQRFYASVIAPPAKKQAAIQQWRAWWAQNAWPVDAQFAGLSPLRPTRSAAAPEFDLRDLDGHPVRLADQHGRVTLLNFWGSWCPPCRVEIPDLVRLDQVDRARGLDIIGIALGEKDEATLGRWCRAHGVAYRQALSTGAVQEAYGHVSEVPVSVLIDRQGRIRYRWDGERDFATFHAAIIRLLSE